MSRTQPTLNAELGWPTGDQPGDLRFRHAPTEAVREAILRALSPVFPPTKSTDATLHALTPPEGIAGRYRLAVPEGAWFVRVSMWIGDAALEKALVDYLAAKDVPVNRLLVAGITLEWDGQVYRVDLRPLSEGRHFDGSLDDMAQVASTLAACHRALASFPQAEQVRSAAAQRYERFAGARDMIANGLQHDDFEVFGKHDTWAAEHRRWLAEMIEGFAPQFDLLPGAQCVHGQVHPGNVLFQGGVAVLVDFEEAVYTYAPPAFDLAYLVQRFCLGDNPSPEILSERLDMITVHYGPLPPLAEMMRQLAWMSMAAIVDFQIQGITVPLSEYEKFVRLEKQARKLIGVV